MKHNFSSSFWLLPKSLYLSVFFQPLSDSATSVDQWQDFYKEKARISFHPGKKNNKRDINCKGITN
jgi:hypothetical protein